MGESLAGTLSDDGLGKEMLAESLNNDSGLKLVFGRQGDRILHISQVENGLNCNCFCAKCGTKLIARHGDHNRHSFAHENNVVCNGANETALHKYAKQFLLDSKKLLIPRVHRVRSYRIREFEETYSGPKMVNFDQVLLEVRGYEGLVPDAVATTGNDDILIEFANTHVVDNSKATAVRANNLSMLEIDISAAAVIVSDESTSLEKLHDYLIEGAPRHWIWHNKYRRLDRSIDECIRIYIADEEANKTDDERLEEQIYRLLNKINAGRVSLSERQSAMVRQVNAYSPEWLLADIEGKNIFNIPVDGVQKLIMHAVFLQKKFGSSLFSVDIREWLTEENVLDARMHYLDKMSQSELYYCFEGAHSPLYIISKILDYFVYNRIMTKGQNEKYTVVNTDYSSWGVLLIRKARS
jgi:hypothetical protein